MLSSAGPLILFFLSIQICSNLQVTSGQNNFQKSCCNIHWENVRYHDAISHARVYIKGWHYVYVKENDGSVALQKVTRLNYYSGEEDEEKLDIPPLETPEPSRIGLRGTEEESEEEMPTEDLLDSRPLSEETEDDSATESAPRVLTDEEEERITMNEHINFESNLTEEQKTFLRKNITVLVIGYGCSLKYINITDIDSQELGVFVPEFSVDGTRTFVARLDKHQEESDHDYPDYPGIYDMSSQQFVSPFGNSTDRGEIRVMAVDCFETLEKIFSRELGNATLELIEDDHKTIAVDTKIAVNDYSKIKVNHYEQYLFNESDYASVRLNQEMISERDYYSWTSFLTHQIIPKSGMRESNPNGHYPYRTGLRSGYMGPKRGKLSLKEVNMTFDKSLTIRRYVNLPPKSKTIFTFLNDVSRKVWKFNVSYYWLMYPWQEFSHDEKKSQKLLDALELLRQKGYDADLFNMRGEEAIRINLTGTAEVISIKNEDVKVQTYLSSDPKYWEI